LGIINTFLKKIEEKDLIRKKFAWGLVQLGLLYWWKKTGILMRNFHDLL